MQLAHNGTDQVRLAFIKPPHHVDYSGGIAAILTRNDRHDLQMSHFSATDRLPDPTDFDAVVITGSHSHINQETTWLSDLRSYVIRRVEHQKPTLGVCFGHQLLGDVIGGSVEKLVEGNAGYHSITATESGRADELFSGIPRHFVSYLWHTDHVTALPPEADILATYDDIIQAFSMPEAPIFGIQFHPEIVPDMAEKLSNSAIPGMPSADKALEGVHDDRAQAARKSHQIYTNFLNLATSASRFR